MKRRLLLVAVAYLFTALFVSCSDDGSEGGNDRVGYESAFEIAYPSATDVTWSKERDYYIASFMGEGIDESVMRSSTVDKLVWYDESGVCYLEEDFIDTDSVPAVIKADFEEWYGDNGGTTTLVSATKGRYKSSVFYKLYCVVEIGSGWDSYTILGTYYYNGDSDFEMMDYDEGVEVGEIKTILPELYAMQYIEQAYSDYCLGVEAKTYSNAGDLEEYGADEFIYTVLLYLPKEETALDLIFIDGSSKGVVAEEFEWGGSDTVIEEVVIN